MDIGIVGLGLIGGSMAMTLTERGHNIYACDIDESVVQTAQKSGHIVGILSDSCLPRVDVLVFALHSRLTVNLMESYLSHLKPSCIVTDVGGVKSTVMARMAELKESYPHLEFIGAHPMAGREVGGYKSAQPGLFRGAKFLYTPLAGSSQSAIDVITTLASELGCGKSIMTTAAEHDAAIAFSSQLPHVISNAYVKSPTRKYCPDFAGGSFMDFIRVAGLNADMWTKLMLDNQDNIAVEIRGLMARLNQYATAIESGDEATLKQLFEAGNQSKAEVMEL